MRRRALSPLKNLYIAGYTMLLPWLLWLGAINDLCIENCAPTPIESFYTRFYYSFFLVPFACHYYSDKFSKKGAEKPAKFTAFLPLILLPVYIVLLFQTI